MTEFGNTSLCWITEKFHEEINTVGQNMKKFGGSFAKNLGEALLHADTHNAGVIKDSFPEMWNHYLNIKD